MSLGSPMSNVQSPTSLVSPMFKVESPRSVGENPRSAIREGAKDVGLWTLDVGLCISDLRKSFSSPLGRLDVLRGVSFSAQPGESVAVVGASGAGKSTLLNLLGGLEAPDSGSIGLGKFRIERAGSSELTAFRRRHIGFIFQFHYLLADLSAVENVALPLLIDRNSRTASMQQAMASLAEMGLESRCDHPITHLSGGEQQRVAVCRALIKKPSLVLADEPTGNLDAPAAQELGEQLISYTQRHRAIVVIATHNEKLAQLCDQTLRIDEGRLKLVEESYGV
jgi:lipoprotein-releasing system ATP-binding protein